MIILNHSDNSSQTSSLYQIVILNLPWPTWAVVDLSRIIGDGEMTQFEVRKANNWMLFAMSFRPVEVMAHDRSQTLWPTREWPTHGDGEESLWRARFQRIMVEDDRRWEYGIKWTVSFEWILASTPPIALIRNHRQIMWLLRGLRLNLIVEWLTTFRWAGRESRLSSLAGFLLPWSISTILLHWHCVETHAITHPGEKYFVKDEMGRSSSIRRVPTCPIHTHPHTTWRPSSTSSVCQSDWTN